MNHRHQMLGAFAVLTLALGFSSTTAQAAWRSFGYPAQHTDLISTKNDAGTAAINLHCLANNNLVLFDVVGGPGGTRAMLTLTVDGKVVAKHSAIVSAIASTSMIEFGGPNTDKDITRWLAGIASATSDVTISAGRSVAHFPVAGARSAATTAMSYCKLQ